VIKVSKLHNLTKAKPQANRSPRHPLSTPDIAAVLSASVIGIFRYLARAAQLREPVREHSSRVFHELSKESRRLAPAAGTARSKLSRRGDRLT